MSKFEAAATQALRYDLDIDLIAFYCVCSPNQRFHVNALDFSSLPQLF
jgi:hypothetical protein